MLFKLNRIQESLIDSLYRLNFIAKNEEILTECVKEYRAFSILGEKFGPFEIGKKYKLKLFKAIQFIKFHILKIVSEEKYDSIDMQRYAITERDDPRLTFLKDNRFINKLKEFRIFTKLDIENGIKPQNFLDNYNSYFQSLLDSRLQKILRMSKSELSIDDEKRLSDPEQVLFKIIHEIISTWRNFFLKEKEDI